MEKLKRSIKRSIQEVLYTQYIWAKFFIVSFKHISQNENQRMFRSLIEGLGFRDPDVQKFAYWILVSLMRDMVKYQANYDPVTSLLSLKTMRQLEGSKEEAKVDEEMAVDKVRETGFEAQSMVLPTLEENVLCFS